MKGAGKTRKKIFVHNVNSSHMPARTKTGNFVLHVNFSSQGTILSFSSYTGFFARELFAVEALIE